MKICKHCGHAVDDSVQICMNCGCMVINKFTATFQREKQWFLIDGPIHIDIIGQGQTVKLSVRSGQSVSAELPEGNYHICAHASIRVSNLDVYLNKNTLFKLSWNRMSGALEFLKI